MGSSATGIRPSSVRKALNPASERRRRASYWKRNAPFYLLLVPGVLYFLVFRYVPLLGSVIAFQDYNIYEGFWRSEWVGFKWFEQFFAFAHFRRLLWNTLAISFLQLLFAFPAPIMLAILLNELRNMAMRRFIQTVVYIPHFLSWVIVGGFGYMLLSPQVGLINHLIRAIGFDPVFFLQEPGWFRPIIVTSAIWKEMGWNAIIFLAAIAGISPTLYEASRIDGAGRWRQLLHVTVPGIMPAIMILFLLKIGQILDVGFEQIYVFLNPVTYSVGDIIDTYAYREGVLKGQYGMTTAIGLFKSIVGFALLIIANRVSRLTTGERLI
ncbi:ABC transporter permease [Cohnella herbarum]|uniref:Sugar ABC transporter permease n=1 Tax=Cohnella herbarum TaxID=2728023 RepID=A0A7Z2VQH2_9BACL|nr:ABC transporter permease subunit [Cohnella herbarum]QJD87316.1 sugar ABC transporter permease [Cohnella herbarum]